MRDDAILKLLAEANESGEICKYSEEQILAAQQQNAKNKINHFLASCGYYMHSIFFGSLGTYKIEQFLNKRDRSVILNKLTCLFLLLN